MSLLLLFRQNDQIAVISATLAIHVQAVADQVFDGMVAATLPGLAASATAGETIDAVVSPVLRLSVVAAGSESIDAVVSSVLPLFASGVASSSVTTVVSAVLAGISASATAGEKIDAVISALLTIRVGELVIPGLARTAYRATHTTYPPVVQTSATYMTTRARYAAVTADAYPETHARYG